MKNNQMPYVEGTAKHPGNQFKHATTYYYMCTGRQYKLGLKYTFVNENVSSIHVYMGLYGQQTDRQRQTDRERDRQADVRHTYILLKMHSVTQNTTEGI